MISTKLGYHHHGKVFFFPSSLKFVLGVGVDKSGFGQV